MAGDARVRIRSGRSLTDEVDQVGVISILVNSGIARLVAVAIAGRRNTTVLRARLGRARDVCSSVAHWWRSAVPGRSSGLDELSKISSRIGRNTGIAS